MTKLPRKGPAVVAAFLSAMIFAAAPRAAEKHPTAPPIPTKVRFSSDLNASIAEAGESGKLVMVDVYTDWCYWCRKLDSGAYSEQGVADAVKRDFIAVKLNPEKDAGGKEFAKKYEVKGYPTILFLNRQGEEVHRLVGYAPPANFLNELRAARKKSAAYACSVAPAPSNAKPAAKCPVTGETIAKITNDTPRSIYQGKTYLFCCPGCKTKFDKDPAKYMKAVKTRT
ncbi:MAG TPA: thioredoxin fold domain-containing protein [Armatimonadota bacterium]